MPGNPVRLPVPPFLLLLMVFRFLRGLFPGVVRGLGRWSELPWAGAWSGDDNGKHASVHRLVGTSDRSKYSVVREHPVPASNPDSLQMVTRSTVEGCSNSSSGRSLMDPVHDIGPRVSGGRIGPSGGSSAFYIVAGPDGCRIVRRKPCEHQIHKRRGGTGFAPPRSCPQAGKGTPVPSFTTSSMALVRRKAVLSLKTRVSLGVFSSRTFPLS